MVNSPLEPTVSTGTHFLKGNIKFMIYMEKIESIPLKASFQHVHTYIHFAGDCTHHLIVAFTEGICVYLVRQFFKLFINCGVSFPEFHYSNRVTITTIIISSSR